MKTAAESGIPGTWNVLRSADLRGLERPPIHEQVLLFCSVGVVYSAVRMGVGVQLCT